MSEQVTIADRQEQVPPYHRFSLFAHCISVFTAMVTTLLLFQISYGSWSFQISGHSVSLALYYSLVFTIILAVFSIPATWICLQVAKRFQLSSYLHFCFLGLIGAMVTVLLVSMFGAASATHAIVESIWRDNLSAADAWKALVGLLSILILYSAYLAPVGIVAALTYRVITGCTARSENGG